MAPISGDDIVADFDRAGGVRGAVVAADEADQRALGSQLPALLTGWTMGYLLDRYQPHLVMAADNFARAAIIGTIPLLYALHALQLWHIYALAAVAGALLPATEAGAPALLPELVHDAALDAANALSSLVWQIAYIVGPALAGLLVATLGGAWALLLDAATFLIMGAIALSLPAVPRSSHVGPHVGSGLWPLVRRTDLRLLMGPTMVYFFAYGPLEVSLPVYAAHTLRTDATGYGLLWSALAVGSLAGVLGGGRIAAVRRPGLVMALIAVGWGLALLPLVAVTHLIPAVAFMGIAGLIWGPYTMIETSLLQRLVPAQVRGQFFGARATLLAACSPVGAACGGLLLTSLSGRTVIGLSAAGCIAVGIGGILSPLRSIARAILPHICQRTNAHLSLSWPEQLLYGLIHPVVLFGCSPAERATETGRVARTIHRKADLAGSQRAYATFRKLFTADKAQLKAGAPLEEGRIQASFTEVGGAIKAHNLKHAATAAAEGLKAINDAVARLTKKKGGTTIGLLLIMQDMTSAARDVQLEALNHDKTNIDRAFKAFGKLFGASKTKILKKSLKAEKLIQTASDSVGRAVKTLNFARIQQAATKLLSAIQQASALVAQH